MNVIDEATPIEVLLVEDDPGDVLMTREALVGSKLVHNLHVMDNGELAVEFLRRRGQYQDAPRPDLILLDLNLPRLDGREVLAQIKGDESLRQIPVVVLTTSDAEEDVLRSYNLHANAYVTKPVTLDEFNSAVHSIDTFFLQTATMPSA